MGKRHEYKTTSRRVSSVVAVVIRAILKSLARKSKRISTVLERSPRSPDKQHWELHSAVFSLGRACRPRRSSSFLSFFYQRENSVNNNNNSSNAAGEQREPTKANRACTGHFENRIGRADGRRAQHRARIQTASRVRSSDRFFSFPFFFFCPPPSLFCCSLALSLSRSLSSHLRPIRRRRGEDLRVLKRMLQIKASIQALDCVQGRAGRRESHSCRKVETRAKGKSKGQSGTRTGRSSNRVSPSTAHKDRRVKRRKKYIGEKKKETTLEAGDGKA